MCVTGDAWSMPPHSVEVGCAKGTIVTIYRTHLNIKLKVTSVYRAFIADIMVSRSEPRRLKDTCRSPNPFVGLVHYSILTVRRAKRLCRARQDRRSMAATEQIPKYRKMGVNSVSNLLS